MKSRTILFFLALVAACGGDGSETCSQRASCALGSGSYELCTSGANASCRYLASDGTSFSCGSCGDCTAAATKVVAWCNGGGGAGGGSGGGSGGSSGGGSGGTGGGGTGGGGSTGGGCVTQTLCADSAKDCAAGQRCNAALNPPVCQALYCGDTGSPCGGDSASDICASRMCVGGVCAAPADMAGGSCCQPGHAGNELGVGDYCSPTVACTGKANACTTAKPTGGFCSMLCSAGDSCGTNAMCMLPAGVCVPTNCAPDACV